MDAKIRKQWLWILILSAIGNIAYSLYLWPTQFAASNLSLPPQYVVAFNALALPLLFSWVIYHCAYKKQGTKLLTVLIYMTPVALVCGTLPYALQLVPLPAFTGASVLMTLQIGVSVWWWFLHLKMREINRKRKEATS